MPEGSPVYTAEGRVYEGGRRPQGTPPQRRPQGRPQDPRTQREYGRRPQNPPKRRPEPPKKKKKPFNKEKFFHGVKLFFVRLVTALLVLSVLGAWWYRAEFYSDTHSRSGKVSYYMKDEGSFEVKASVAYKNDVLYTDFTEISKWFGMVSVGSVNSMRFICTDKVSETSSGAGGEEYAIFTNASTTVLVNGTSISLEAPCRVIDSHIWIPLSFVENYVSGVACERSASEKHITFNYETDEDEEEKDDEKKAQEEGKTLVRFKVKQQNAIPNVKYPAREEAAANTEQPVKPEQDQP